MRIANLARLTLLETVWKSGRDRAYMIDLVQDGLYLQDRSGSSFEISIIT